MHAATMTEEVKKLASVSLQRPVRLAADAAASAPKQLTQEVLRLKGAEVSLVCSAVRFDTARLGRGRLGWAGAVSCLRCHGGERLGSAWSLFQTLHPIFPA